MLLQLCCLTLRLFGAFTVIVLVAVFLCLDGFCVFRLRGILCDLRSTAVLVFLFGKVPVFLGKETVMLRLLAQFFCLCVQFSRPQPQGLRRPFV